MTTQIAQLQYKEVIRLSDCARLGYVNDLEIDLETGRVLGLLVPGRRRLFGLLGREQDHYIPWGSVQCFGEDIILIESSTLL